MDSPTPRKKRGPVPTGKGTQVQVRMPQAALDGLLGWIEAQPAPKPSRPEAMRLLMRQGLTLERQTNAYLHGGHGVQVQVRMHPPDLAALDGWIAGRPEPKPTRPEAIRILMRSALKAATASSQPDTPRRSSSPNQPRSSEADSQSES